MKAPDLEPRVVILITEERDYVTWWCRACKYGDMYQSGLGRVLESVDGHVHDRHQGQKVELNIPQHLMTSRVWHFESRGICRCAQAIVGDRILCDNCNGVTRP